MKQIFLYSVCCFLALIFCACGNQPTEVSRNAPSNVNAPGVSSQANSPAAASQSSGAGEAIDTAKYDAAVDSAKKQAERRPNDAAARAELAHAYLERANALRDARQYRVALGDYRRTLQYDPVNRDAQQNAAMIVMIMKQMGREVPEPGQEPTPLPFQRGAASRPSASNISSVPLSKSH
ncbi:MAG TPA: hypothetical protein VK619_18630 [Pyrinomonadaceae bacterium]|nr:hypothetical protein [Pyrinomonadaceae bacterium]